MYLPTHDVQLTERFLMGNVLGTYTSTWLGAAHSFLCSQRWGRLRGAKFGKNTTKLSDPRHFPNCQRPSQLLSSLVPSRGWSARLLLPLYQKSLLLLCLASLIRLRWQPSCSDPQVGSS